MVILVDTAQTASFDVYLNFSNYVIETSLCLLHDSRQGSSSTGSQMTIFYGGQAHVFDNVHPNKVCLLLYLITPLILCLYCFCMSVLFFLFPSF